MSQRVEPDKNNVLTAVPYWTPVWPSRLAQECLLTPPSMEGGTSYISDFRKHIMYHSWRGRLSALTPM